MDRLSQEQQNLLLRAAAEVRQHAYAKASSFAVGAAVLSDDGRVFVGCNVENASYGLTICAERNAIGAAVAAGARSVRAVAVVTSTNPPARPCGACRQVLAEFGVAMTVVLGSADPSVAPVVTSLRHLLPEPFTFSDLA